MLIAIPLNNLQKASVGVIPAVVYFLTAFRQNRYGMLTTKQ